MDTLRRSKPFAHRVSVATQTALESLAALGLISAVTLFAVHALCRFAGMPSPLIAIAGEQLLWSLPAFAYLWAMFYMIELARVSR